MWELLQRPHSSDLVVRACMPAEFQRKLTDALVLLEPFELMAMPICYLNSSKLILFKQRKLAWFSDLHLEASYLSPSCGFAEGGRKTNASLTPTWQSRKWELHRLWDDEKSNKGKKSGNGRGQKQNVAGNTDNNEDNGGKR